MLRARMKNDGAVRGEAGDVVPIASIAVLEQSPQMIAVAAVDCSLSVYDVSSQGMSYVLLSAAMRCGQQYPNTHTHTHPCVLTTNIRMYTPIHV